MLRSTIKNIPGRVIRAAGFSASGLRSAFLKEEAFRLECLALAALTAVIFFTPWPLWKKLALSAVYLLIPLSELFNSALEDLTDLVSPDYHPLAKSTKDKGSAAVLTAIVINLLALMALLAEPSI
jgi:diacylglycerol kinase (ATP)